MLNNYNCCAISNKLSCCHRLPNEKLYTMDSDQEAILVLRAIGSIKQKPIYLRDYRAHLMAEAVSYELDNEQVRLCYFCLPLRRCCFQSCLSVCLQGERPHVTTHRPVETCFGILVTSLGFKARVGSLIHLGGVCVTCSRIHLRYNTC